MKTGWTGEGPDAGAPPMPLTERLLASREHRAGVLETALARSAAADARQAREAAEQALDPDDYAANLIGRGYMPGMISQLSMQLGDVETELQGEREKLDRGARRAEHVRRAHEAGRIGALDVMRALGDDLGDEGRVRQLERQAASLRQQIEQAHDAISPPERRAPDPLEAAASRAHQAFAEVTRAKMAEAEAGRPAPRERRPFGSASRAGVAVRSEHCIHCIDNNVSDEDSYLLHSDPEFAVPVTAPGEAEQAGYRSGQDGRVPMIYR